MTATARYELLSSKQLHHRKLCTARPVIAASNRLFEKVLQARERRHQQDPNLPLQEKEGRGLDSRPPFSLSPTRKGSAIREALKWKPSHANGPPAGSVEGYQPGCYPTLLPDTLALCDYTQPPFVNSSALACYDESLSTSGLFKDAHGGSDYPNTAPTHPGAVPRGERRSRERGERERAPRHPTATREEKAYALIGRPRLVETSGASQTQTARSTARLDRDDPMPWQSHTERGARLVAAATTTAETTATDTQMQTTSKKQRQVTRRSYTNAHTSPSVGAHGNPNDRTGETECMPASKAKERERDPMDSAEDLLMTLYARERGGNEAPLSSLAKRKAALASLSRPSQAIPANPHMMSAPRRRATSLAPPTIPRRPPIPASAAANRERGGGGRQQMQSSSFLSGLPGVGGGFAGLRNSFALPAACVLPSLDLPLGTPDSLGGQKPLRKSEYAQLDEHFSAPSPPPFPEPLQHRRYAKRSGVSDAAAFLAAREVEMYGVQQEYRKSSGQPPRRAATADERRSKGRNAPPSVPMCARTHRQDLAVLPPPPASAASSRAQQHEKGLRRHTKVLEAARDTMESAAAIRNLKTKSRMGVRVSVPSGGGLVGFPSSASILSPGAGGENEDVKAQRSRSRDTLGTKLGGSLLIDGGGGGSGGAERMMQAESRRRFGPPRDLKIGGIEEAMQSPPSSQPLGSEGEGTGCGGQIANRDLALATLPQGGKAEKEGDDDGNLEGQFKEDKEGLSEDKLALRDGDAEGNEWSPEPIPPLKGHNSSLSLSPSHLALLNDSIFQTISQISSTSGGTRTGRSRRPSQSQQTKTKGRYGGKKSGRVSKFNAPSNAQETSAGLHGRKNSHPRGRQVAFGMHSSEGVGTDTEREGEVREEEEEAGHSLLSHGRGTGKGHRQGRGPFGAPPPLPPPPNGLCPFSPLGLHPDHDFAKLQQRNFLSLCRTPPELSPSNSLMHPAHSNIFPTAPNEPLHSQPFTHPFPSHAIDLGNLSPSNVLNPHSPSPSHSAALDLHKQKGFAKRSMSSPAFRTSSLDFQKEDENEHSPEGINGDGLPPPPFSSAPFRRNFESHRQKPHSRRAATSNPRNNMIKAEHSYSYPFLPQELPPSFLSPTAHPFLFPFPHPQQQLWGFSVAPGMPFTRNASGHGVSLEGGCSPFVAFPFLSPTMPPTRPVGRGGQPHKQRTKARPSSSPLPPSLSPGGAGVSSLGARLVESGRVSRLGIHSAGHRPMRRRQKHGQTQNQSAAGALRGGMQAETGDEETPAIASSVGTGLRLASSSDLTASPSNVNRSPFGLGEAELVKLALQTGLGSKWCEQGMAGLTASALSPSPGNPRLNAHHTCRESAKGQQNQTVSRQQTTVEKDRLHKVLANEISDWYFADRPCSLLKHHQALRRFRASVKEPSRLSHTFARLASTPTQSQNTQTQQKQKGTEPKKKNTKQKYSLNPSLPVSSTQKQEDAPPPPPVPSLGASGSREALKKSLHDTAPKPSVLPSAQPRPSSRSRVCGPLSLPATALHSTQSTARKDGVAPRRAATQRTVGGPAAHLQNKMNGTKPAGPTQQRKERPAPRRRPEAEAGRTRGPPVPATHPAMRLVAPQINSANLDEAHPPSSPPEDPPLSSSPAKDPTDDAPPSSGVQNKNEELADADRNRVHSKSDHQDDEGPVIDPRDYSDRLGSLSEEGIEEAPQKKLEEAGEAKEKETQESQREGGEKKKGGENPETSESEYANDFASPTTSQCDVSAAGSPDVPSRIFPPSSDPAESLSLTADDKTPVLEGGVAEASVEKKEADRASDEENENESEEETGLNGDRLQSAGGLGGDGDGEGDGDGFESDSGSSGGSLGLNRFFPLSPAVNSQNRARPQNNNTNRWKQHTKEPLPPTQQLVGGSALLLGTSPAEGTKSSSPLQPESENKQPEVGKEKGDPLLSSATQIEAEAGQEEMDGLSGHLRPVSRPFSLSLSRLSTAHTSAPPLSRGGGEGGISRGRRCRKTISDRSSSSSGVQDPPVPVWMRKEEDAPLPQQSLCGGIEDPSVLPQHVPLKSKEGHRLDERTDHRDAAMEVRRMVQGVFGS
uniref:Uncharacterized protein n=1 Tax=Chromera velia CCMP2878 TaxID=1169474 RepID=A0A0G4FB08_9ALVE|eukprot:Cvel_16083.t1-p1 / transcript=Cvel_16083.t1 / gene=Cvel_16083 / organism=Chromera_velia_CCMP2878 / gene_product=hypothetical protein / transcript_product=hypothetical protein / location=Cvel_scaffold1222:43817-51476(+) / protein_length=2066 / sequence_SO=supercontig / SO=protein_coding / is_pseudo=false